MDFVDYHQGDREQVFEILPTSRLVRASQLPSTSWTQRNGGSKKFGVSWKQDSDIVICRSCISPVMAIRLDTAFGGGVETWYQIQTAYDIALALKVADQVEVERIKIAASAGPMQF